MSAISQIKAMGGIGSILVLLTPVPSVGWILAIAGLILILVAIKRISDIVNDSSIYSNMILSVVLAIASLVVGAITVIAAFLRILGMGSFVGSTFVLNPNLQPGDWAGFALAVLPGLIAIWILLIVSAIFLRKSFDSIAKGLNVHLFATGALIFLIGAVTAVIAVGFLLILISEIIFAIAFFSIPDTQEMNARRQPA